MISIIIYYTSLSLSTLLFLLSSIRIINHHVAIVIVIIIIIINNELVRYIRWEDGKIEILEMLRGDAENWQFAEIGDFRIGDKFGHLGCFRSK
jgi:hypothetical protein